MEEERLKKVINSRLRELIGEESVEEWWDTYHYNLGANPNEVHISEVLDYMNRIYYAHITGAYEK